MSATVSSPPADNLLEAVEIGAATIDDMSSIRHLHAASARRLAAGMLTEAETAAFANHMYSEAYSERLAEAVLTARLFAARLAGDLVGTAGWTPTNDSSSTARLIGIFTSPLYAQCGIGRRLLETAEADSRQAGFRIFTVRSPLGASGFFERQGYETASHGVWPLTRDAAIPVAFLRKAHAPLTGQPNLHTVK